MTYRRLLPVASLLFAVALGHAIAQGRREEGPGLKELRPQLPKVPNDLDAARLQQEADRERELAAETPQPPPHPQTVSPDGGLPFSRQKVVP
jgi:hypothetical protein